MNSSVITILVISAIIGISSYGVSAAYQSWEKRNREIRRHIQRNRYELLTRRVKKLLLIVGVTGIFISIISNFTIQREGLLYADGLSIVDTPSDLKPTWVYKGKSIQKGQLIAKFSPANPSLQIQKVGVQNNQASEKAEIGDKISSLVTNISRANNEVKINQGLLELANQKQAIAARLAKQGALSKDIQREREAEVKTIKQKEIQIRDSLVLMKERLVKLQNSFQELEDIGYSGKSLNPSDQFSVYAEEDGDVLFRSNSLRRDSDLPLIVFGKNGSISLQLRLLNHEAKSLEKSKRIYAEWIEGTKPNQIAPTTYASGIPKRFEVNVTKTSELVGDSEHRLVFLTAEVPPRAIVDIARDRVVPARLVWKPSLYFNPTFRISAIILLLGIIINLRIVSKMTFLILTEKQKH